MRRVACALVLLMALAAPAAAQNAETLDPIRCWWRTSHGAVAIGEPFEATLTCAVREQESVRTVPDESRLPATTIQLAPFEVLGGSHPSDLRSPTHRFLQYHYALRIIDRDVIGHDARFPDLQIGYRVHTRTNGEWVQGRDRTYVMPGRSVRVLSLVPTDADDIRDSGAESFARVASLRYRARALQIGAGALVLLGAIVAVPAVARLIRRQRKADDASMSRPPRRAVLAAAEQTLSAVGDEARGGWTPDLAVRALNALRLIAASAIGRDVVARPPDSGTAGWVTASGGLLRRRQFAVTSAVTPLDVRRIVASLPPNTSHERQQMLEQIADAMDTVGRSLYTSRFDATTGGLDSAVATGRTVAAAARRQR